MYHTDDFVLLHFAYLSTGNCVCHKKKIRWWFSRRKASCVKLASPARLIPNDDCEGDEGVDEDDDVNNHHNDAAATITTSMTVTTTTMAASAALEGMMIMMMMIVVVVVVVVMVMVVVVTTTTVTVTTTTKTATTTMMIMMMMMPSFQYPRRISYRTISAATSPTLSHHPVPSVTFVPPVAASTGSCDTPTPTSLLDTFFSFFRLPRLPRRLFLFSSLTRRSFDDSLVKLRNNCTPG